MNDYRNRVELPTMGVFLQPDPIGFKGDAANIYRFCGNDPVDRTDPIGLVNTSAPGFYSTLTSFGGGDWIKGSDGLSAMDWNDRRPQAGMDGGGGGGGGSPEGDKGKSISAPDDGKKGKHTSITRIVGGTPEERKQIQKATNRVLYGSKVGREAISLIKKAGTPLILSINSPDENYTWTPWYGGFQINISPILRGARSEVETTAGTIPFSLTRQIAHELGHAVFGEWDDGPGRMNNVNRIENPIMRSLVEPERVRY